jgi:(R,R)-butanediol dehydrogenase/meso-butanediol dehydrogenase/diacetyl reductase
MVTQRIPLADIVEEGFEALLSDKAQVKIIVTP